MPAKLVRRLKTYFVSRRDLHNCRVYRGTDQSIPDATTTAISFSAQRFDTSPNDDIWAIGLPTRLVCRRAGKYQISGGVRWADDAVGYRELHILLNNTTIIRWVRRGAHGHDGQDVSTLYKLSVGDFVELMVRQTSGGALNVVTMANYSPEFEMARVG